MIQEEISLYLWSGSIRKVSLDVSSQLGIKSMDWFVVVSTWQKKVFCNWFVIQR